MLIGNYMNGTSNKGGAFGFRVSSINKVLGPLFRSSWSLMDLKLADTKSSNSTTLVHFLERTVAKHFPEMEAFIDELAAPADAYRSQSSLSI